jgi:hypothetical protein
MVPDENVWQGRADAIQRREQIIATTYGVN